MIPSGSWGSIFFPIAVLVAVLPGLYALKHWDLTPPGPWWGMRGLAVLEGHWLDQVPLSGVGPASEARAFQLVAMQPPLQAWLEALAMGLSSNKSPLTTVVPSYVAGAIAVLLVFRLGSIWGGPALGLVAAVLTGFNRELLAQLQHATPTAIGLASVLAALLGYSRASKSHHARVQVGWCLLSGLCLGLSLLSIGVGALAAVVVVLLHRAFLGSEPIPAVQGNRWQVALPILAERGKVFSLGVIAVCLALTMAAPWYWMMSMRYGGAFWASIVGRPISSDAGADLLTCLLRIAPATLMLGLHAAARASRSVLVAEPGARDARSTSDSFWLAWLAVAAVAPAVFPVGLRATTQLFLLVPLNLLAARTIVDLATRKLPVRALAWLAPATVLSVAWWASPELREALAGLARGQRPSAGMALGLHLGLDVILVVVIGLRGLNAWARHDDGRRRALLGVFLAGVIALTIATGVREVGFRHRETTDLLALRDSIVSRASQRPFALLAVLSSDGDPTDDATAGAGPMPQPGGRLRFVLRSALPHLAQIDVAHVDDLLKLPDTDRLVVLAGTDVRLSYALQAKLKLEVLHPGRSGLLAAYSTPIEPPRPRTARR